MNFEIRKETARKIRAINNSFDLDLVSMCRQIGEDPTTFFEFGDWDDIDFRESDLTNVSFRGARLRRILVYAEQLNVIRSTDPAVLIEPSVTPGRPSKGSRKPLDKSSGPILRIETFGSTGLSAVNGDQLVGLGAKAQALIVYLASKPLMQLSRDSIVDLLWERVAGHQGKGSLRQELRRFKKVLGEEAFEAIFQIEDDQIGLRRGSISIDVDEFEAAASSDDPEELAAILKIYRGEFLRDNSARSVPFQEWAQERRNYLTDLFVSSMSRLAMLDLDRGKFERCKEAAKAVVDIDPLHEPAQEALIKCLIATGARGQARNAYENFRTVCIREIGTEPESSLSALLGPDDDSPSDLLVEQRASSGKVSIAILDISKDEDEDFSYLASGVVEEVAANLARSNWLTTSLVNAPSLPRDINVQSAQGDLRDQADYLLRVNVQVKDERVSVVSTLSRIEDNATLFSDSMQSDANDILLLQHETAIRIASIFEEKALDDRGEMLRDAPLPLPQDMNHWTLLMRARWLFWKSGRRRNFEARELLMEVQRNHPSTPQTYSLLTLTHVVDAWNGWTEDVQSSIESSIDFATQGLRAAPADPWAQYALGVAYATSGELERAELYLTQASRLSSMSIITGELARLKALSGETVEAERLAKKACEQSPYDPQYAIWVRTRSIAQWIEGNLEKALELIDYCLIVRPGWMQNHIFKSVILYEMGKTREASIALHEISYPNFSRASLRSWCPLSDESQFDRLCNALFSLGLDVN